MWKFLFYASRPIIGCTSARVESLPLPRPTALRLSVTSLLWPGFFLFLAGCVTNPYPADWAPILADGRTDCASLAGFYENFGTWDDGDPVAMATIFFPLRAAEPLLLNYERLAVTRLSITLAQDSAVDVRAWVGDDLLLERRLDPAEVECRGQQLALHDSSWQVAGVAPFLPVLGRSSVERLMGRTSDGSLVIENHEFSAGAVVVVPMAVKARYWFRFAPSVASPATVGAPELPRGVRREPPPVQVLVPPTGSPDWSGYGQATECLARAAEGWTGTDDRHLALLEGRSTQSFILQNLQGSLAPHGIVRGNDWLPASHDLRVEKQHRESPQLADRYVLCLLGKGYRWEGA